MLVVPINKDTIETSDGAKYKVVEYTNYKDGGPAVYAKSPISKEIVLVYFIDIESINGTKVEYQRGSKIFKALGKVAREQQLPQPDDEIVFLSHKSDEDKDNKEQSKVADLKLKSKSLGINKGMFVKDDDGNTHRLKHILDIIPTLGGYSFNREDFLKYYKDYIGV